MAEQGQMCKRTVFKPILCSLTECQENQEYVEHADQPLNRKKLAHTWRVCFQITIMWLISVSSTALHTQMNRPVRRVLFLHGKVGRQYSKSSEGHQQFCRVTKTCKSSM